MPLLTHIKDPEIIQEESVNGQKELSLDEIGAKLSTALPELNKGRDVTKILNYRGASVEYLIDNMLELMHSTDNDRLRKDLLMEALDMHGVRKQQEQSGNSINLVIQDGDVKVQNVLLPNRD